MLTSEMRLPLQTLPAFRAVARLANLRAAAEELHLTHSAVSQQIKLLEEQLGFEVFDRPGRRIALNAAGEALLQSIEPALDQIDDGMRAAAAAASGTQHRIRITLLPSFAQRWWLPRMAGWRERHPDIAIEMHTSQQVIDLQREGFHAALRQGSGQWRGLEAERLIHSPLIAVGSPTAARRLLGAEPAELIDEPLLGDASTWEAWFAKAGVRATVNPVAIFNDAGLMLQAAEQNLGLALARELLVADALRDGRLKRLSTIALDKEQAYAMWFAYPSTLQNWEPLCSLREWLFEELKRSEDGLRALDRAALPPSRGTITTPPRRAARDVKAVKAVKATKATKATKAIKAVTPAAPRPAKRRGR
jgi:LysR family transcriptional regulator, glycine cleavage system transcriptional activator